MVLVRNAIPIFQNVRAVIPIMMMAIKLFSVITVVLGISSIMEYALNAAVL